MTIRCVSFNPAIDQTVTLERLVPGEVVRALAVRHDAGGKGVNVASCLADAGQTVELHGLLGRDNAAIFEQLFAAKGIADRLRRVPGATRTNVKLLETGGRTTDVNLPGFTAAEADAEAVAAGLAQVGAGELVVISGSQPAGLAADTSARLAAALAGRGARVVADLSGPALDAVLALPPRRPTRPHQAQPRRARSLGPEALRRTPMTSSSTWCRPSARPGPAPSRSASVAKGPGCSTTRAPGSPQGSGSRPRAPWGPETPWSRASPGAWPRASPPPTCWPGPWPWPPPASSAPAPGWEVRPTSPRSRPVYVPGCNVENASFGGTICAERSAVVAAVSQYGRVEFESVTVVTDTVPPAYPCAFCRGVLSEFCGPELIVYLATPDGVKITTTLGEILPHPFKL